MATKRRRQQAATLIAGGVVIAAGIGVAVVETFRMPKGSIWLVVAAAVLLVLLIRLVSRRL
jgi:uncharacterized membrane protein YgaE (UPF0421/DUF939 family)